MIAIAPPAGAPTIWTIGHSTLEIGAFLAHLAEDSIAALIDVRRFPGSRRHPQFGRDALAQSLSDAGVGYTHAEALGGRRAPHAESVNTVWRTTGFRGYADHMASAEFVQALDTVIEHARIRRSVLMCAEGLWWQCHRSLIADNLALRGWQVLHILPNAKVAPHAFREPAHLVDGVPVYNGGQAPLI